LAAHDGKGRSTVAVFESLVDAADGLPLRSLESGALAVLDSVMLAGLFGVMRRVVEVTFGDVRVVARLFMIARLMVFSGGEMVFGGVFVVLRCLTMMFCCFFGHA
jgi:hypothetical protein